MILRLPPTYCVCHQRSWPLLLHTVTMLHLAARLPQRPLPQSCVRSCHRAVRLSLCADPPILRAAGPFLCADLRGSAVPTCADPLCRLAPTCADSCRKRLCAELQRTFTEPGQPGEMFSGVFRSLAERLMQPEAQRGSSHLFANGQRRILPSFFELVLHLHATRRSFTLVFRTFGTDIADVVEEINMFAAGQHPSYPGVYMDGRDGRTDIRLSSPASTAAFIRCAAPCMLPTHAPCEPRQLGVRMHPSRLVACQTLPQPTAPMLSHECGCIDGKRRGDTALLQRATVRAA
jgi:hypothetical protein